jgi:hypothetical protein
VADLVFLVERRIKGKYKFTWKIFTIYLLSSFFMLFFFEIFVSVLEDDSGFWILKRDWILDKDAGYRIPDKNPHLISQLPLICGP